MDVANIKNGPHKSNAIYNQKSGTKKLILLVKRNTLKRVWVWVWLRCLGSTVLCSTTRPNIIIIRWIHIVHNVGKVTFVQFPPTLIITKGSRIAPLQIRVANGPPRTLIVHAKRWDQFLLLAIQFQLAFQGLLLRLSPLSYSRGMKYIKTHYIWTVMDGWLDVITIINIRTMYLPQSHPPSIQFYCN